jgi:hypothetical protein
MIRSPPIEVRFSKPVKLVIELLLSILIYPPTDVKFIRFDKFGNELFPFRCRCPPIEVRLSSPERLDKEEFPV